MDKSCCEDCGHEFEELYGGLCQDCADEMVDFPEDTLAWLFVASTLKNNPELKEELDKLIFYLIDLEERIEKLEQFEEFLLEDYKTGKTEFGEQTVLGRWYAQKNKKD